MQPVDRRTAELYLDQVRAPKEAAGRQQLCQSPKQAAAAISRSTGGYSSNRRGLAPDHHHSRPCGPLPPLLLTPPRPSPPFPPASQLDDWELREDAQGGLHLTRSWPCASFQGALALARRIAALAEREGHHPDLHLTGTRRSKLWAQ